MDDHCKLGKGEVFQDYYCLLNFVDEKSDKFYRIQVLKNDKGFHVWTRWGRNVSVVLYSDIKNFKQLLDFITSVL
jgi:predicted DNA-binding WGR domain protein